MIASQKVHLNLTHKLRGQGKIAPDATVVLMLTGSGLKDLDILRTQPQSTV
jgi:threonine synthase